MDPHLVVDLTGDPPRIDLTAVATRYERRSSHLPHLVDHGVPPPSRADLPDPVPEHRADAADPDKPLNSGEADADRSTMFWRRKHKDEALSKDDQRRYEENMRNRLRGIGSLGSQFTEEDADAVEARLRNMVYGTNRE
ncbi:MAG TPA: hypothetical protein ENK55_06325 [Actinobacteria bacterium]|nr:hypothetical protein [Actinomycetota bacterium]